MKFSSIVLFICLISVNLNGQEEAAIELDTLAEASIDQGILGLAYNLYALKAQKLDDSRPFGHCRIPGGVLLDPRKSYSSKFEKDEYFSDNAKILKENEVFQLPGYFRMSKIYRTDIKDYFIATKVSNQWTNHDFKEIMEFENVSQGDDIGCPQCNFRKIYYNDRDNCAVTVYYQIFPLRTRNTLEFQESITGENVGVASTLVLEEEESLIESNVKTRNTREKAASKPKKRKFSIFNKRKKRKAKKKKQAKKEVQFRNVQPTEVKYKKDFFGENKPYCDSCDTLKKTAIDAPNNNYCATLKKDEKWVEFYQCQINCFELMTSSDNSKELMKAKTSLKRHQTNIEIRSKRCR